MEARWNIDNKRCWLFIGFVLAGLMCSCRLSAASEGGELKLIPRPKKVTMQNGMYDFANAVNVALTDANSSEDKFAAEQLIEEVEKDLGIKLSIKNEKGKNSILLGRMGDIKIDSAAKNTKMKLKEEIGEQGYVLTVSENGIFIMGADAAGVFYGVQTLKQLIRGNADGTKIPCCEIKDWPTLKNRGWQDDIARGPIPTMELFKKEIRTMAEYKMNQFMYYDDHVFKLWKHPRAAPEDGITAEEVNELCDYAKDYHVELIANWQSAKIANWSPKGYEPIREGTYNLISPALEMSYGFLADVYSEIAPAFCGRYFHINCDEHVAIGKGASKKMAEEMGEGGTYAYFINRLNKLLKPYNKEVMFWGDIALKYGDSCISKLDKDLIVMSWDYNPSDSFVGSVEPFAKAGLRFYVCPCTNNYGDLWPRFDDAVKNISNFTTDGVKYGAMGLLVTAWDDNHDTFTNYRWYPYIWGAQCGWDPIEAEGKEEKDSLLKKGQEKFDKAFDEVFYGVEGNELADALLGISRLRRYEVMEGLGYTAFWNESVGKVTKDEIPELRGIIEEIDLIAKTLEAGKDKARYNKQSLDYAIYMCNRAKFIAVRKLAAGCSDGGAGCDDIDLSNDRLRNDIVELKKEFLQLWDIENRNYYRDFNEKKYDKLIESIAVN